MPEKHIPHKISKKPRSKGSNFPEKALTPQGNETSPRYKLYYSRRFLKVANLKV